MSGEPVPVSSMRAKALPVTERVAEQMRYGDRPSEGRQEKDGEQGNEVGEISDRSASHSAAQPPNIFFSHLQHGVSSSPRPVVVVPHTAVLEARSSTVLEDFMDNYEEAG